MKPLTISAQDVPNNFNSGSQLTLAPDATVMSVRTTVYDPVAAAAAEQAAAAAAALEDAGGAGGEDESKGRERAVATFVRC